jgi:hypothetical protein
MQHHPFLQNHKATTNKNTYKNSFLATEKIKDKLARNKNTYKNSFLIIQKIK